MSRGVIYVMTTVVPGLIKIGKTGTSSFEQRMYQLEHNGYSNVVGLKRKYAIEVDNYDEKEQLLHTLFSKSQVAGTELFATDVHTVVQLLSSFEGTQIYPEKVSKEEAFDRAVSEDAAEQSEQTATPGIIPDGFYTMERKIKREGITAWGRMRVEGGSFTVLAGGKAALTESAGLTDNVRVYRNEYIAPDGTVTDNVTFASPSGAGSFLIGASCDGWVTWKSEDGRLLDEFRKDGQNG